MDALYTGRGPVCGITMRRGAGTMGFAIFAAADSAAIAVTAPAAPPLGAVPACGAAAACSVTAAGAAGASATGGAATTGALTAIFSSRAAGAAGCFTTTPAGGGATTTTGRAGATPTGALATTAPAGGRDAMAGVDGGRETMGGAERGCGTILRGSGLAGAASTGLAAIGAAAMGAVRLGGRNQRAALPEHARGAPLLPLPSSWPGWPSARRPAWRCARDRSWVRWLPRRGGVRAARMRRGLCLPRKVRTNLLRLVQFQRAGVRLPARNAEFRKNVENRPRLNFQLFREIVDTNLTHPPLFNVCRQKVPSRS